MGGSGLWQSVALMHRQDQSEFASSRQQQATTGSMHFFLSHNDDVHSVVFEKFEGISCSAFGPPTCARATPADANRTRQETSVALCASQPAIRGRTHLCAECLFMDQPPMSCVLGRDVARWVYQRIAGGARGLMAVQGAHFRENALIKGGNPRKKIRPDPRRGGIRGREHARFPGRSAP